MKSIVSAIFAAALVLAAVPAQAALKLFTCEPEWAALAKELGGDKVDAFSATTALQDPHRIQARPSLIARVRSADLLICSGAELEIGWLPLLLRQTGNARIQPGSQGYIEAALLVPRLEVPTQVDRSMGDVHPSGNPHIQTDPRNIARVAEVLAERLAQVDPASAGFYRERYADFAARWQAAIIRWEEEAAPLRGQGVIVHHKTWAYLLAWLGMREVATLEPKPGIEPGAAHLEQVMETLAHNSARVILRAPYNDARPSEYVARKAGVPAVILPGTVGGSDRAQDLFSLFDDTLARLLNSGSP